MPEDSGSLGLLTDVRRRILGQIKERGQVCARDVSEALSVTGEAARQHLTYLESRGWIERQTGPAAARAAGRPRVMYRLSPDGEALFPKRYSRFTIDLMDAIVDAEGQEGLRRYLDAIADKHVADWEERLDGRSLGEKLDLLTGYYFADGAYARTGEGPEPVLTVTNCPYHRVAMAYPDLCRMVESILERLLGVRVERTEAFQDGDGRCTFHPVGERRLEIEKEP